MNSAFEKRQAGVKGSNKNEQCPRRSEKGRRKLMQKGRFPMIEALKTPRESLGAKFLFLSKEICESMIHFHSLIKEQAGSC